MGAFYSCLVRTVANLQTLCHSTTKLGHLHPQQCHLLADKSYMKSRSRWKKMNSRKLPKSLYGRTSKCFRRSDGAVLLLHRPRSRNAKWYNLVTIWVVTIEDVLVRRRCIYGRRPGQPPFRWANSVLRKFCQKNRASCFLLNGRKPSIAESIRYQPMRQDELPVTLRTIRWGGASTTNRTSQITFGEGSFLASYIRTNMPVVPPHKLIVNSNTRYRCILSVEELDLFNEMWAAWLNVHPEYANPACVDDLTSICMETVIMFRINLLAGGDLVKRRYTRAFHRSFCRKQRARRNLGATRRQRLLAKYENVGIFPGGWPL